MYSELEGETNQDNCKYCPSGYQPSASSRSCELCPRGKYYQRNHDSCVECVVGQYGIGGIDGKSNMTTWQ